MNYSLKSKGKVCIVLNRTLRCKFTQRQQTVKGWTKA